MFSLESWFKHADLNSRRPVKNPCDVDVWAVGQQFNVCNYMIGFALRVTGKSCCVSFKGMYILYMFYVYVNIIICVLIYSFIYVLCIVFMLYIYTYIVFYLYIYIIFLMIIFCLCYIYYNIFFKLYILYILYSLYYIVYIYIYMWRAMSHVRLFEFAAGGIASWLPQSCFVYVKAADFFGAASGSQPIKTHQEVQW